MHYCFPLNGNGDDFFQMLFLPAYSSSPSHAFKVQIPDGNESEEDIIDTYTTTLTPN